VLNQEFGADVREAFAELQDSAETKSIVLISGKPGCFIAGADINMLAATKEKEAIKALAVGGQEMIAAIESSKKPIVAAIAGSCMGGGLEMALGCHYRVALDDPKTKLSLPEVMLGLLPGSGGTQRLPQLIGLPGALPMMLTGAGKNAKQSKKLGLVDRVVDTLGPGNGPLGDINLQYLEKVAVETAAQIADGSLKIPKRGKKARKGLQAKLMTDNKLVRNMVVKKAATAGVMKQTYGNYPAPLKIIEAAIGGLDNPSEGYALEAELFSELAMTDERKSLMGLYFGQQQCTKNPYPKPEYTPQSVGVLGAGLMGAGIAYVSLPKIPKVILKDVTDTDLSRGEDMIGDILRKKVKKRQMSQFDCDKTLSSLITETNYEKFKNLDIIIEAVPEDINLKHRIIKEVESMTPDHCIFASNTSALPITDLAKASVRPDKFIGMHYFSPVDKMPLLEIITTDATSQETLSAAVEVGLKQKKTIIVVKDGPGFYTTRVIGALMGEAFACLQEGTSPADLDTYFKKFGWPVGGATLVDEVGIDVAYKVTKYFLEVFGERISAGNPAIIQEMVDAGCLGKKSGKGIFLYGKGKSKGKGPRINPVAQQIMDKYKIEGAVTPSVEDVQWRTYLRSVNEAALCLQEEILANPVDGNIGAVFGIGHCPQRGGPFQFLDSYGHQNFVDQMNRYQEQHGFRFEPAQIVVDSAKSGESYMKW